MGQALGQIRLTGRAGPTAIFRHGKKTLTARLTPQDRSDIARALMGLFDTWGLDTRQRIALLGLPPEKGIRDLNRMRHGEALPEVAEILARARLLLEIQHALEITLPHNTAMVGLWVTTGNIFLENQRPLDVMLNEGMAGVERVARSLHRSDDWG